MNDAELDSWIRENSVYLTNMKYVAIRQMVEAVCQKTGNECTPKMYKKVRRAIIYYFFN